MGDGIIEPTSYRGELELTLDGGVFKIDFAERRLRGCESQGDGRCRSSPSPGAAELGPSTSASRPLVLIDPPNPPFDWACWARACWRAR